MRDKNIASMKYLRKTLRNNGTPAEGKLWSILKNKQVENLTFRRQFSIGKYILDFYCPTLRLAIELDGNGHNQWLSPELDYERDNTLSEQGVNTLRFENRIVFEQPDEIVNSILQYKDEYQQKRNSSSSKLEEVGRRLGGVCEGKQQRNAANEGHTPQSLRDSSHSLGEQLQNSSSKLEEVGRRLGGVCEGKQRSIINSKQHSPSSE